MSKELDLPMHTFSTQKEWETWLSQHFAQPKGIWLQFFKKASGKPTVTYGEALDVALCYGWIDGQVNTFDEESYIQRFTPRRAKSMWSQRNREHIARLTKEGRMQPSGLKQVEAAKADGRWEQAYGSPKMSKVPEDFLQELAKDPKAETFFRTLNKANIYAITWRLETAKKPETRERRMKVLLEMMARGEKLH